MVGITGLARVAGTVVLLSSSRARAAFELGMGDDSDLTDFVTRPDIKAPILNVTKYHPDRVAPGYFFTAPYVRIYQQAWATSYYQPCQTGPHIYDNDGELVWSGACRFVNRNQADFRPVYFNGSWHLSSIDMGLEWDRRNEFGAGKTNGRGFVMDERYDVRAQVRMPKHVESFNMHEFRLVDDGKSALAILHQPEYTDVSMLADVRREAGWVDNMGFVEVEIATGKTKFHWMALDHLSLSESTTPPQDLQGPLPDAWDFFHLTSVDKSRDGDYLISSRHTDTVYRISRKDGSIQWRLGGKHSDFDLRGFAFSRQHDARFLDPQHLPFQPKKGIEYISLFNNAADETDAQPAVPTMLILALDVTQRSATIVRSVPRPDGAATLFGGNGELLPGRAGNLFVSWAGPGYATEHDADDRLVMEARFTSARFTTYRAFKSDFRAGAPVDGPPALVCEAFGTARARATTACWVSWNGATEVRRWRFLRRGDAEKDHGEAAAGEVLGTVARTGFETRIQSRGFAPVVVAQALAEDGTVLGASDPVLVRVAQPWKD